MQLRKGRSSAERINTIFAKLRHCLTLNTVCRILQRIKSAEDALFQ